MTERVCHDASFHGALQVNNYEFRSTQAHSRQGPHWVLWLMKRRSCSQHDSVCPVVALQHNCSLSWIEQGDKKRATARLRSASKRKSHHLSTVRSGIAIGLAVPALAMGIYQSEFLRVSRCQDIILTRPSFSKAFNQKHEPQYPHGKSCFTSTLLYLSQYYLDCW